MSLVFHPSDRGAIRYACLSQRRQPCTYPRCGGCDFITRRIVVTAPLSTLTHNVASQPAATSWLAFGEPGRVTLLANTPHDWRFAVVQAVHELVEGALHRHAGLTAAQVEDRDLDLLEAGFDSPTAAHAFAWLWEGALAQRLGIALPEHARVTRGLASDLTPLSHIRRTR